MQKNSGRLVTHAEAALPPADRAYALFKSLKRMHSTGGFPTELENEAMDILHVCYQQILGPSGRHVPAPATLLSMMQVKAAQHCDSLQPMEYRAFSAGNNVPQEKGTLFLGKDAPNGAGEAFANAFGTPCSVVTPGLTDHDFVTELAKSDRVVVRAHDYGIAGIKPVVLALSALCTTRVFRVYVSAPTSLLGLAASLCEDNTIIGMDGMYWREHLLRVFDSEVHDCGPDFGLSPKRVTSAQFAAELKRLKNAAFQQSQMYGNT